MTHRQLLRSHFLQDTCQRLREGPLPHSHAPRLPRSRRWSMSMSTSPSNPWSHPHFQVVRGPYRRATATSLNHEVVLLPRPLPPPLPRPLSPPPPTCRHRGLPPGRQMPPCLRLRLRFRPRGQNPIPMIFMSGHTKHLLSCLPQLEPPQTGPGSVHWPFSACPRLPDRRPPRSQKRPRGRQQRRRGKCWLGRGRDGPRRKE
jgi:hypothetical protein